MSLNTLNANSTKAAPKLISDGNFEYLLNFLKKKSGLSIDKDKSYLVETRLTAIAKENGFSSIDELIEGLKRFGANTLQDKVAEAMATYETLFFRDKKPFDQFKEEIIPDLMKKREGTKKIDILSAACSSGQEPYSLAILLEEMAPQLKGWDVRIKAIDFSQKIIDQAKEGMFTQFEVQRGMPVQYLMKYFQQVGTKWQIKPGVKSRINFQVHNLLDNLQPLGTFDLIYCRNALFYFDVKISVKS